MNNGVLKLVNNRLQGSIRTYKIGLDFWLEKNPHAFSEASPQYLVMTRAPAGHTCQIGASWEKTIKKGKSIGQLMYSITLEDPAFGEDPVYLSAFPAQNNTGLWEISVERKRQNAGATVEQGANVNGSEIPGDFSAGVAAVG
jgi:uncharacterized protein (DUF736 family)